jgi:hypothetical protein
MAVKFRIVALHDTQFNLLSVAADRRTPREESMKETVYCLPLEHDDSRKAALGWLILGLFALIASGLFAVLLVLSRTPKIQDAIPWIDFFHTALVVHVDLSVLIWFVAFCGVLWTLACPPRGLGWNRLSLAIATLGTLVVTVSPFLGAGDPLMNNYIPVLQHPLFFVGLGLFGLGMAGQSALAVAHGFPRSGDNALKIGAYTAAWAAVLSLLALLWTYQLVPAEREGRAYFETLFWGGGHIVQVAYTQGMLVSWLWLASALGLRRLLSPRLTVVLLILGFAPVLLFPMFYLDGVSSVGYTLNFTRFMEYGGGIAALPIGGSILAALLWERGRAGVPPEHLPLRAALITSLLLFGAGGVLGFLITGVNTVIPAHYHGSIVGVTLAFMGMTYYLLPRFGFRAPVGRLAHWQPYVYALGQLFHIAGLAWSGFHGVARKTAGSAQGLEGFSEIAGMALMGLGGLISIIGGILFLVVALRAMWPGKKST